MDDLHLQADLFFGPCNDPACPGSRYGYSRRRLELVLPPPKQQPFVTGVEDQS